MAFDVYQDKTAGKRRYRWTVTNNAAVPEPLAVSSESYTQKDKALDGAAATLRQLLDNLPDADLIVGDWLASEAGKTITIVRGRFAERDRHLAAQAASAS